MRGLFFISLVIGTWVSEDASAYPEMIRHGYLNCTSCHVSPNGAGILNGYGRVQAEEVMSTWSREGEAGVLHGMVPNEERQWSFGGQFRALQMWQETAGFRAGRFVWMQGDVEGAAKLGPVQVVATAGFQDVAGSPFISRRHYAIFKPSDASAWSFRAGRFIPAFGLNLADHAIATKAGIGLGQGIESYNLEAAWIGEQVDVFLTANFGRPGEDREAGVAARAGLNLGDRAKVGGSYSFGRNSLGTRHLVGSYALVGFSESAFLLAEFDWQFLSRAAGNTSGPASYFRLDYEVFKGVHVYTSAEIARTNAAQPTTYAAGVGLQFFPRPHFEFRTQYDKRRDAFTNHQLADYGWLMFHYYL